jgi:hypothetical protein
MINPGFIGLSNALTREFLTAMVRCELRPRPTQAEHSL